MHASAKVVWVVKQAYAELLESHPGIDRIVPITYFYQWILLRDFLVRFGFPGKNIIDLHINGKQCSVFKRKLVKKNAMLNFNNHLTGRSQLEAFTIAAGLPPVNNQPVFYINKAKSIAIESKPYIVFHTQSNMKMKDWNIADWNCLCRHLISQGFTVIEVGLNRMVTIDDEGYVNMTGKMSLQSIASVIDKSYFFIGIDSGFAHMANALQKKGLVLIGQYKLDTTVFNKYNPFTGMYASPGYILYANDDIVSTITCNEVKICLAQKLGAIHDYGQ
jgi:ADP-heptose:LPS heptosyltransferase